MSGDSSDPLRDVDEWLRKIPSMEKAVQEDVATTQQSVDDKVRKLRGNIAQRNAEIEDENQRLRRAMRMTKTLERQLLDNKEEINKITSKTKKLKGRNKSDEDQIDAIKSSHKDAENRLRRVEEGIKSLGNMLPKPAPKVCVAPQNPEVDKLFCDPPDEDDVFIIPRKRQRTGPDPITNDPLGPRDTTTFKEVYDSGKTMQEIIKCPKTGQYFVLACSEHGLKFGMPALDKASAHAMGKQHGLHLTQQQVIDIFGVQVLECRQWH